MKSRVKYGYYLMETRTCKEAYYSKYNADGTLLLSHYRYSSEVLGKYVHLKKMPFLKLIGLIYDRLMVERKIPVVKGVVRSDWR